MSRFEKINYAGPMPNKCHEDDENYIKQQLMRLPTNILRAKCSQLYSQIYLKVYAEEEKEYKKDNKARRESNTRLRVFIDKQIPYLMGKIDNDEEYKP